MTSRKKKDTFFFQHLVTIADLMQRTRSCHIYLFQCRTDPGLTTLKNGPVRQRQ